VYKCRIHGRVGRVDRRQIGSDADVRNNHAQVGRSDDLPDIE
jgi:hypothetical protein